MNFLCFDRNVCFKVGLRDFSIEDTSAFIKVNDLSPQTSEIIDQEISTLLNESYGRAKEVLSKHKVTYALLDVLAVLFCG